jgi:hypothetical protein
MEGTAINIITSAKLHTKHPLPLRVSPFCKGFLANNVHQIRVGEERGQSGRAVRVVGADGGEQRPVELLGEADHRLGLERIVRDGSEQRRVKHSI